MNDLFVNKFLTSVNQRFSTDDLEFLRKKLLYVAKDYDITPVCTDLVVYDNYIPDCYKTYMVTKKLEGLSVNTLKLYNYFITEMFREVHKPLNKISANDIRLYLYNIQEKRHLKNTSIERRRISVSSFFSWCAAEGYLDKNPMANIKPIKCEKNEVTGITQIELEKVRRACKTIREEAVIETLYSTGCRVSELSNLKISDINFETGTVKLFDKGNKHRVSFLSPKASVLLQEYLHSRVVGEDTESVFLFERFPYGKLEKRGVERLVTQIGERVGIHLKCHQLRHTMATEALKNGMSITDLQRLLGHTNINTTTIYAKTNLEAVKLSHSKYL